MKRTLCPPLPTGSQTAPGTPPHPSPTSRAEAAAEPPKRARAPASRRPARRGRSEGKGPKGPQQPPAGGWAGRGPRRGRERPQGDGRSRQGRAPPQRARRRRRTAPSGSEDGPAARRIGAGNTGPQGRRSGPEPGEQPAPEATGERPRRSPRQRARTRSERCAAGAAEAPKKATKGRTGARSGLFWGVDMREHTTFGPSKRSDAGPPLRRPTPLLGVGRKGGKLLRCAAHLLYLILGQYSVTFANTL